MMRHSTLLALGVALAATTSAGGQVSSTLQSINLTATKNQSVTLGAPSPGSQSVTLVDGQYNQYTTPFSTTVGWDVNASTSTTVKLIAYFPTPSAALVNGSDQLPSSLIEVSTDGGATWHALSGNAVGGVGTAGGSYVLYTSPVTTGGNRRGNITVTFSVRVNLTGSPTTSAGAYSGTLNLMAICS
jgi:hypothetical protein